MPFPCTLLVRQALANSFTPSAIRAVEAGCITLARNIRVVLGGELPPGVQSPLAGAGKVIWFGDVADPALHCLRRDKSLPPIAGTDECLSCPPNLHHTESAGHVVYGRHSLLDGLSAALRERPFTRFDFTQEWNNLGFGRICTDEGLWAVRGGLTVDGAQELAGLYLKGSKGHAPAYAGSYLTLVDTPTASILWCARPVGLVDSAEWSIIERFVSDWRSGELPCLPSLCQTPAGCQALVTMRLDCDEAVGSARDLFEWYTGEGLPFSLAVKTSLSMTPADMALLRDVHATGGTLLSHSHSHQPNWGTGLTEAMKEAQASRQWFRERLPEAPPPELVVSPFHTNPPYAMQAIEAAGFRGVVSGIIHNDPEYLLGRAGVAPYTIGLVTISQQSMLHGDCYAQQGESVSVHADAFEIQATARGIFGYLDHPFSERYQYGWQDKAQRLSAHKKLVATIRSRVGAWFWSQRQCFDFVRELVRIRLETDERGHVTALGADPDLPFRPEYRYRGEHVAL